MAFQEETGIPYSTMVVLFQNNRGNAPDGSTAAAYAEEIGAEGTPVVADLEQAVLTDTPYTGNTLPGVCALSPEMEILRCAVGEGRYHNMFEVIQEHYSAR